jgi:hypothetical protein
LNHELTEPHFDDERTLLSARRVIPLDRVDSLSRRKQWWLSATVAIAAVLGTLGGFVVYKRAGLSASLSNFNQNVQAGVSAKFEPPEAESNGAVEILPAEGEQTEIFDDLSDEASELPQETVRSTPRRRQVERRSSPAEDEQSGSEAALENESEEQTTSRRVDSWEERRERRARRRNQDEQPNDLFRIDQIFEGAPRP